MSRTERTRYAAVVALVLLAIWGIAGCTGNGNPAASPTTTTGVGGTAGASATASGAATASATGTVGTAAPYPSDVPPEARVNSDAGAIAFTRHFFAQVNKAYTTPQSGLISPLSTPSCKSCSGYESRAIELERAKQRYDRTTLIEVEIVVVPQTQPGVTLIDYVFRQADARLIDMGGQELSRFTAKTGIFVMHAKWTGTDWRAAEIQIRQP